MRSVMLVPNDIYPSSLVDAEKLETCLLDQGIKVVHPPRFGQDACVEMDGVGLVVSLGGDGTLLRAAHLVGERGIPILGLSYGHLGFLTADANLDESDTLQLVQSALAGELHVTRRSVLRVDVEGQTSTGEPYNYETFALNEAVLSRGALGKIVEFDVQANGVHIDRLRADGFVVATATGSTGYALSAGGPIVSPDFYGLVCVPVAPHTITARAFITSPSDVVELLVVRQTGSNACVFVDGQILHQEIVPNVVQVRRADFDILLLGARDQQFFESVSRVFYGKVR